MKKRKDCEDEEECSVLLDEENEAVLIKSIDESGLKSETKLPISNPSDISEYKLSNGSDLLNIFKRIK